MATSLMNRARGICSHWYRSISFLMHELHPRRIRKHLGWLILLSVFPTLPVLAVVFIVLSHR